MSRTALVGRWALLLSTALILQAGVAPQFPLFGVTGDLMVGLAVAAGLSAGAERGAIVGFWCGLLFDLLRPGVVGPSALAYCLVACLAGLLAESVLQLRGPLAWLVVGTGSSAATLLYAAVAQTFGAGTLTNPQLWRIVGVVGLANVVAAPLLLWAVRRAEGLIAGEDVPAVLTNG